MLARVGQRLLRDAEGVRSLVGLRFVLEAIVREQSVDRRDEPRVVELEGDEAGDEPAYLPDRVAHAGLELDHHHRIVWPAGRLHELPQPQQHDDHGLQRAVVDLAGDTSALLLLGGDDVREQAIAPRRALAHGRIALSSAALAANRRPPVARERQMAHWRSKPPFCLRGGHPFALRCRAARLDRGPALELQPHPRE